MRARYPLALLLLTCLLAGRASQASLAQGSGTEDAIVYAAFAPDARHLVVTSALEVCPENLEAYRAALRKTVTAAGGYVAGVEGAAASGLTYTLRIPTDAAAGVLEALQAPASAVISTQTADHDVTRRIDELQAHIDQKRRTAQRYADVLTHARVAGDVLTMEERLGEIRAELKAAQSELRRLEHAARFATVRLRIVSDAQAAAA